MKTVAFFLYKPYDLTYCKSNILIKKKLKKREVKALQRREIEN